jgi:hypothetical protein
MLNRSKTESDVPFFYRVSNLVLPNYPCRWSNLVANLRRPISNWQAKLTFVDLLGVDYDMQHLDNSLFADYPIDAVRYLLAPEMHLLTES